MDQLDDLLLETSRTFALTIPLLPEPTRRATCLAYLLFRISDTFEDASTWTRDDRIAALRTWSDVLRDTGAWQSRARSLSAEWLAKSPSSHEGYLRLIGAIGEVLAAVEALTPPRRHIVVEHAIRSADGMADVLGRSDADGFVRLLDLADLQSYCYIVAGIVGELLTSLFLHDSPILAGEAKALRAHERAFGEALQLVNILKDEHDDASEGRRFLPGGVARADIIKLARGDLAEAQAYTDALERGGAPRGFIAFTSFPRDLAQKTLDLVEKDGPGAKVSRMVVMEMMLRYRALAAS
jgi:farnesyl-diphosphate farnesyltransferase